MKIYKILAVALGMFLTAGLAACSDDEPQANPLPVPSVDNSEASYNSLTFSWSKIERATKYGYTLTDADGHEVVTDVTSKNSVTFSGLKPSTDYTLSIWAYGVYGSGDRTSDVTTITKRTSDIIYLAEPQPVAAMKGNSVTVSWNAVADADGYEYEVTNPDGSEGLTGSTSDTGFSISGAAAGTYVIRVRAVTGKGGYGNSGWTSIEYAVTKVAQWSAEGTYYNARLGRKFNATIYYYGENSYTVEAFMGVPGYDLSFVAPGAEDDVAMEDLYEVNDDYYYVVPTGLDELPNLQIYAWYDYCSFAGDEQRGELYLYTSYTVSSDEFDSFTWGPSADSAVSLCGTWNFVSSGQEIVDHDDWTDFNFDGTVEVTLNPDNDKQIKIGNVYWSGYPFYGTVDFENLTVTFEAQAWGWYVFAGEASYSSPVVGTISSDLNRIEIKDFGCWYVEYDYNYMYGTSYVLTRNGAASAPARVKATALGTRHTPAPGRHNRPARR